MRYLASYIQGEHMVLPLGAVRQWRRPAGVARRLCRLGVWRLGVWGAVNVRGGTVPWRQGRPRGA